MEGKVPPILIYGGNKMDYKEVAVENIVSYFQKEELTIEQSLDILEKTKSYIVKNCIVSTTVNDLPKN